VDIKQLALAEKSAEADRRKADGEWRGAWWQLTTELGRITDSKKATAAKVLVMEITGQSDSYVRQRKQAGAAFLGVSKARRIKIKPRWAIEIARQHIEVDGTLLRKIGQAEKAGLTLREFTKELTGKGWADTVEGTTKYRIAAIIEAQPDAVAQVIVDNPNLLRAVNKAVTKSDAGRAMQQSIARGAKEREARGTESSPPRLRGGLAMLGVLLEVSAMVDDIVANYQHDSEGADAAIKVAESLRYNARKLESWAGGFALPISDSRFEEELRVLLGEGK